MLFHHCVYTQYTPNIEIISHSAKLEKGRQYTSHIWFVTTKTIPAVDFSHGNTQVAAATTATAKSTALQCDVTPTPTPPTHMRSLFVVLEWWNGKPAAEHCVTHSLVALRLGAKKFICSDAIMYRVKYWTDEREMERGRLALGERSYQHCIMW